MAVLRPSTSEVRGVTVACQFVQVKDAITYRLLERRADGTVDSRSRLDLFNTLVQPNQISQHNDS